jgi:hypothetical protein
LLPRILVSNPHYCSSFLGSLDGGVAAATPAFSMRLVSKRIHRQWHGAPRVVQVATLISSVSVLSTLSTTLLHAAHQRKAEV